jgi:hypothetical protein
MEHGVDEHGHAHHVVEAVPDTHTSHSTLPLLTGRPLHAGKQYRYR